MKHAGPALFAAYLAADWAITVIDNRAKQKRRKGYPLP